MFAMKLKSSGSKQLLRVTTVVCLVVVILGDYYQDLQLEKGEDSTEKEIKKQFRILSKKYHPDVNPSDSARELYQKIQRAHEVLSDKRKKKMYDLRGEEGLKQLESNAQGSNMSDPFSAFFGAQNDGGQREQKIMNVDVSLEDMYIGRTMNISYRKQKLCRSCKGTGAASMDSFIKCSKCHGTGKVTARMQFGPFIQTVEQQCPQCAGKGKQVKHVCTVCKGHKVSSGTQVLQVEVERGIPEGHEVVYEMEADEYPDKIPADLTLVFKSRNHNRFVRDGNHLHTTLTISLKDSLVGFRKEIRHLDDHEVVITRDETTPYGTVIRLPGEGMPVHNIPSERGDLLITVKVTYPKYIPLEKRERLAELLSRLELHKS